MPTIRRRLLIIAAAGIAVRLFLAFHWFGNGDIFTFAAVGGRTLDDPLHTYAGNIDGVYWPYPPGYLAWLVAALKLAGLTGLPFQGVVQILPILADLAIAALIYWFFRRRGATERTCLAAFSLVMLGPIFIAISGYHGQIDPVAILPGVAALIIWEQRPRSRRALAAGLLVGVGAALKTVPFLLLVPFAAASRSRREVATLVAAAAVVVAAVSIPFYLAAPAGFRDGLSYAGVPGRGGLSVILDPGFAVDRRFSPVLATVGHPNSLTDWLSDSSAAITLVVLAGLGAFLLRYRPAPLDGIVLLWLSIFVFNPNFLPQYFVWALPFFIMAGYLIETALLQIAMVPVLFVTYLSPNVYGRPGAIAYVAILICLWVFWAVALVVVARRVVEARRAHPEGIQPPLIPVPQIR